MFCPDCGKPEQKENTYCRSCGEFLSRNNSKQRHGKPVTPDEQIKMSLTFNLMSAIASFVAGLFLLFSHLGSEGTHVSVFVAMSVLFVIGAWQMVSFFNNRSLRKRFLRQNVERGLDEGAFDVVKTNELLPEADFSDVVPASVTEKTTKNLSGKVRRSSQTKE